MSDISHFCTQWPRAVVISGFLNFKPKVGGEGEVILITARLFQCSHSPSFSPTEAQTASDAAERHLRKTSSCSRSSSKDFRMRYITVPF